MPFQQSVLQKSQVEGSDLHSPDDEVGDGVVEGGARVLEDADSVEHDRVHAAELLADHQTHRDDEGGEVASLEDLHEAGRGSAALLHPADDLFVLKLNLANSCQLNSAKVFIMSEEGPC